MRPRTTAVWLAGAALGLSGALLPIGPASAATLEVCATGCTYTTIKDAVAAAAANDVIEVGAGTYVEHGITIQKPLTIRGAGAGQTIVDGGGITNGTVAGVFRINPFDPVNGSGPIEISDLTVQNPGRTPTAVRFFAISIAATRATTGITAINLHDLDVHGKGETVDNRFGYGIYANSGRTSGVARQNPPLTIRDSTFEDHDLQAIGVDGWTAPVTIADNDLREGTNGNTAILVFNEYQPERITAPVRVTGNTSVGKLFAAQNIELGTVFGGFDDIEVSGNTVTGLAAGDFAALFATNSTANTEPTWFGAMQFHDNVVRGDGTSADSYGVQVSGHVASTSIEDNDIAGVETGVIVELDKSANVPGAVTARHNRLFAERYGVSNATSITVDAAENWWGCVRDPLTATNQCSGVDNSGSGAVTTAPWIRPVATASDDEVDAGGTLDVDVALRLSNGSQAQLPSFFTGLATAWSADRGTLAPAAGTLTSGLTDASTYTAPSTAGADTIRVRVDRYTTAGPALASARLVQPAAYGDAIVTGEPVEIPLTVVAAPTTPPPTTEPTEAPVTDDPDDDVADDGDATTDDDLSDTGSAVGAGLLALGLVAVAGGAAVLVARRRMR